MALDMYSEISSTINASPPRLSFSHNLPQTDTPTTNHPYPRLDSSLLQDSNSNSNPPDFDFCITNDNSLISSADELFSQGLIRPLQLQDRSVNLKHVSISNSQLPPLSKNADLNQETSKPIILPLPDQQNHSSSKSFWRIKRSSSLHVDEKTSFWSSLPRSNSTGSVPSPKQINSQRQPKPMSGFYMYSSSSQKPPLKRYYGGGGYGNGVRINPVLNVPPPFISKGTASFFGLGSLFGNGSKDKKNKK